MWWCLHKQECPCHRAEWTKPLFSVTEDMTASWAGYQPCFVRIPRRLWPLQHYLPPLATRRLKRSCKSPDPRDACASGRAFEEVLGWRSKDLVCSVNILGNSPHTSWHPVLPQWWNCHCQGNRNQRSDGALRPVTTRPSNLSLKIQCHKFVFMTHLKSFVVILRMHSAVYWLWGSRLSSP